MRQKSIHLFLTFLLSVFAFNLVADCVAQHKQALSSYCCDMNEVEEINELESRLRSFEPADFIILCFNFNFIQDMFSHADSFAWQLSGSRAFFPHALHVPIYLDKCTILV